jgi:hypothetical protein
MTWRMTDWDYRHPLIRAVRALPARARASANSPGDEGDVEYDVVMQIGGAV